MALILNIDTSSTICSICLSDSSDVIAEENDPTGNKHAAVLAGLIKKSLHGNGVTERDLTAVAVSSGPGSYTGLRIGVSMAKGLCYGLDIPLIAVPTLQGIAHRMCEISPDEDGIYVGMIDAGRNNIYMAIYDAGNNIIKKDTFLTNEAEISDIFALYYDKHIYFGGTGCLNTGLIDTEGRPGTIVENVICAASNITVISYKRYIAGEFENLTYFEPFYLKEFEGRMKIQ